LGYYITLMVPSPQLYILSLHTGSQFVLLTVCVSAFQLLFSLCCLCSFTWATRAAATTGS